MGVSSPPLGEGGFFCFFSLFSFGAALCVFEPVAFSVGFDDVDAVGNAVEQRAGEAFVSEDLGPLLEGQVGGEDEALAFVGAAYYVEEEFGASFGERHVAEFVEHDEVEFLDAFKHPLELPVLPCFEQFGDEGGHGVEADAFCLGAGGVGQRCGDVCLSGARIAHQ